MCERCNDSGWVFQGGVFGGQQVGGYVPCSCTAPPEQGGVVSEVLGFLGAVAIIIIIFVAIAMKG